MNSLHSHSKLRGYCNRSKRGAGSCQLWCHLYVNPEMQQPGFDLNKKIIGKGGRRTRCIFEASYTSGVCLTNLRTGLVSYPN